MRELALFAGAGGGILGGKLLGWRTVCAVERDAYAAQVLAQRQNDRSLQAFPIWSDVETFDGKPWRGIVDVVSGGFPCQDISAAGKGAGITGERSGLWGQMARIIREVRPRYTFIENSPMLSSRGLDRVLCDIAKMGLNAEWCVLGADDCGAQHIRKRIWMLAANTDSHDLRTKQVTKQKLNCSTKSEPDGKEKYLADSNDYRLQGSAIPGDHDKTSQRIQQRSPITGTDTKRTINTSEWPTEPNMGRVANGVAFRVDRLKAIGNGQVPRVAATAFELLRARIESS